MTRCRKAPWCEVREEQDCPCGLCAWKVSCPGRLERETGHSAGLPVPAADRYPGTGRRRDRSTLVLTSRSALARDSLCIYRRSCAQVARGVGLGNRASLSMNRAWVGNGDRCCSLSPITASASDPRIAGSGRRRCRGSEARRSAPEGGGAVARPNDPAAGSALC